MNQNQTTGRNYQEVAAGGSDNQRWEPQKNESNPQYPMQIEGYLSKHSQIPGQNGVFSVFEIQMMNPDGSLGAKIDVSGGKVLENKLMEIRLNSFVMIQYKGKVKGKGNTYNDWATFVDQNAIPLDQLLGKTAPQQHFQQQAPVQQQMPIQQQNSAPAFNQTAPQNPAQVFGGGQQQNTAPVFNQAAPQQNAAPVFGQQQAPAFNNGQMAGVQQGTNPFGNQAGGDLPFN